MLLHVNGTSARVGSTLRKYTRFQPVVEVLEERTVLSTNLALNPSAAGIPSPLESDRGWGGGSYPWDLVDGVTQYSQWAHGLAFTGGHVNGAGSGGWVEPAGRRQATIDFGKDVTFDEIVIWHHGGNDVPATAQVEYWDGGQWNDVLFTRFFDANYPTNTAGWSKPDTYSFNAVVGSKVRYAFDNSGNSILGTPMRHGWIYEFEVFAPDTDIVATGLNWNATQGGVDLTYEVKDADLTADTNAALYWANGPTFADAIGPPVYETLIERPQGQHGPFYVPETALGARPANATHLLLVVDLPSATDPQGLIIEADESNNVRAVALPDIEIFSATTTDSRSVSFQYQTTGSLKEFEVDVYRSANNMLDPTDMFLGTWLVGAGAEGTTHTGVVDIDLPIDTAHPYVFVVADPDDDLLETDEGNNEAYFRKRVLGVVTHGFNPLGFTRYGFSGWITDVAATLRHQHRYDRTVAFDWNRTSYLPRPGMTEQAGQRLARRVARDMQRMQARWRGDVIDVHFIGHSRGAVVISRALQNLVGHVDVTAGYTKMTMLDPHPAHNHFLDPQYSVIPNRLGQIAELMLIGFQAATNDPEVFVPRNADETIVYFQRTPWFATGHFFESILNLWGEAPVLNLSGRPLRYHDLTGFGMSHTRIVDWYQNNVLDSTSRRNTFHTRAHVSPFQFDVAFGSAFDDVTNTRSVTTQSRAMVTNQTDNRNDTEVSLGRNHKNRMAKISRTESVAMTDSFYSRPDRSSHHDLRQSRLDDTIGNSPIGVMHRLS